MSDVGGGIGAGGGSGEWIVTKPAGGRRPQHSESSGHGWIEAPRRKAGPSRAWIILLVVLVMITLVVAGLTALG